MAVNRKRPTPRAVRKAKLGDGDWVAVFDREGKLIGICDRSRITPVTDSDAVGDGDSEGVTKATRRPGSKRPALTPEERRERAAQLRKGLSGPGMAADGDKLAKEMGEAAQRVLRQIHDGGRAA